MQTRFKEHTNVLNMSKAKRDALLQKLEMRYDSAAIDLRYHVKRLFPEGTLVKVKVFDQPERIATVKGHSLYPDQVMINGNEHISWKYLEKING